MSAIPRSLTLIPLLAVSAAASQTDGRLFDAPVVVVDEYHRIEHLLDLDDDGHRDAVSWWWSSSGGRRNIVTGLLNDGTGDFTHAWVAEFDPYDNEAGQPSAVSAVSDFDGDGKLDVAVAQGERLVFYHLRGTQQPIEASVHDRTQEAVDLVAGDLDGDGFGDALVLYSNGRLRRFSNQGPENDFAMNETASVVLSGGYHSMRLAELTGDGLLDALFVTDDEVMILPMAAGGQIGAPTVYAPTESFQNPMPTVGDVDGDGDTDAVVFEGIAPGADRYHVLRRAAGDELVLESPVLGGPATALYDIDRDGDLDGICCGGGSYIPPKNDHEAVFHIAIQEDGVFRPAFTIPSLGAVHIAGAADLDLDGDEDLVAGRVVYLAEGHLTGDPYARLSREPRLASDYDGDGDPDMDLGLGPMHVNDGTGACALSIPTTAEPPQGSTFVGPGYAGDFDADGDEDLIVGMFSGASFQSMRRLENQGGGYFADAGDAAAPGVNWSLGDPQEFLPEESLVADADGDGDLDVTIYKQPAPEPEAQIWLNDGAGSFEGPYAVPRRWPLAYADFDEDGTQDMVCAFRETYDWGQTVKWEPGSGPGTFLWNDLNRWLGGIDATTDRVGVFDIDGDGHLDVGVPDRSQYGISWTYVYRNNNGPNNFHLFDTLALEPKSGHYPADIRYLPADLDDDGLEDLAITSALYAENAVAIHRRTAPSGAGAYQLAPLQLFEAVSFEDVDGDGDLDAVGESIVENLTYRADWSGARRQYGASTPGTGGALPVLGASGAFRTGETAELRMTGGLGGALAQLVIADAQAGSQLSWPHPAFGTSFDTRFRRLSITLGGDSDAIGAGEFVLSFTVPPHVAGTTVHYELYVQDPSAEGGWSRSNALEVSYP